MTAVLEIVDYSLCYQTNNGLVRVLKDINLQIARGEILGLVGESGSGKTSLAWSIMRFLASNAIENDGRILLSGENIRQKSPSEIRQIRGKKIAMIFQDPGTSLTPTVRLGRQISEVLVAHRGFSAAAAWSESKSLLARVGLADPEAIMRRMPHEVSGGEKQRVVIATAFACQPECIVLDEPTTALDVLSARQVLDILMHLQAETGVAALYISHDLSLVARTAHRIVVLSEGKIVEEGCAEDIFDCPRSSFAKKLASSVPRFGHRLVQRQPQTDENPLLEIHDLTVEYKRASFLPRLFGRNTEDRLGNDSISLCVGHGEIVGIVGESGSGKSTLAKALSGIIAFEGHLLFNGTKVSGQSDMDRNYRRDVQMIFQHPDASLNPRQRVAEILSRPLKLYGIEEEESTDSIDDSIHALLQQVRLPKHYADRYPHQLSGGEKQRVAIARAFASRPKMIICDEITSALDVSVQASIVELLIEMRRLYNTAYLFITHDLKLISQIAHRIGVMYRGKLVEVNDAEIVTSSPSHPYTQALVQGLSGRISNPSAGDDVDLHE